MSEGRVLLAVAAGGAVGSLGRWLVALGAGGAAWGALLVNVTGALVLGLLAARIERGESHVLLRPFLTVGLLGGWTTYSAFALDVHQAAGDPIGALAHVAATLAVGTGAAMIGMLLGENLWRTDPLAPGPATTEKL